ASPRWRACPWPRGRDRSTPACCCTSCARPAPRRTRSTSCSTAAPPWPAWPAAPATCARCSPRASAASRGRAWPSMCTSIACGPISDQGGTSMTTATQPLNGTFKADPVHSSFGFAVRHMGVSTFRGTFSDVDATLADGVLDGRAKVESISIVSPADFRAHVLGEDFFAADAHPEVTYRSTAVDLADDGTATVRGELTIKGITREVVATGTWTPPAEGPWGG